MPTSAIPCMNLRCLLVEDHLMFLQLLATMLRAMPHLDLVATAQTVAEGNAACEKLRPALLILDLALPDGPGLEVARKLIRATPDAKVIILSAQAGSFMCPAWLDSALHAVVDKTQAFELLEVRVKELLPRTRTGRTTGASVDPIKSLTQREYEMFLLIGRGLTSKEIAIRLGIALHTVHTHRKHMAEKLSTAGAELTREAMRHYHETFGAAPRPGHPASPPLSRRGRTNPVPAAH